MTDERLLTRASRGDEAAFLLLYERHRDAVFRFAYRMLGSTTLAEDVTHDCFLSILRQPERFDAARSELRTYLLAAARNLALKHFRATAGEVAAEELEQEPNGFDREAPLQRLLDEELAGVVREAVESLPPLQREALLLFEYEELSLMEVAEVVGADVGTVKSRLRRARQRLKRLLEPYWKGDAEVVAVKSCEDEREERHTGFLH